MENPDRGLFLEAQDLIFELLRSDSFRKYRKSSLYRQEHEVHIYQ